MLIHCALICLSELRDLKLIAREAATAPEPLPRRARPASIQALIWTGQPEQRQEIQESLWMKSCGAHAF